MHRISKRENLNVKKIMFVIGSLGNGGAERVIALLGNYFSKKGYDISIVTLYCCSQVNYPIEKNVKIIPIEVNGRKIKRIKNRIIKLREIVNLVKPDVVISFLTEINIYTIISMVKISIPLIISERNDPENDPKQKILRLLRQITYKWSSGIVFQTEQAKKYFSNLKIKSAIIPNPINGNLPRVCNYDNRKNTIVSVCRLDEQKNIPMLIEAFEKLPEEIKSKFLVEIYGEGPLRRILQELIESKKLEKNIVLKGFSTNIYKDILTAKLYVSTSNYEGISNSMLEALALGIPTICTDCPVGGARLAIQNNYNGILVDVGDVGQLRDAMLNVLTSKTLALELSSHFMETREKFSEQNIIMLWEDFIEEILCNENGIA